MAVTVTYGYPTSGTVNPTVAQMNAVQGSANAVLAEVYFGADSDTTAVITHNLNLATTGATPNTGQQFPTVFFYVKTQGGTGTVNPVLSCTVDPNICTISKTNLANTSCTVRVAIHREHSLMI